MSEESINYNKTLRLLSLTYHVTFIGFYILLGWGVVAAIQSMFSESGIEMLVTFFLVPLSILLLIVAIGTRILYKRHKMKLLLG